MSVYHKLLVTSEEVFQSSNAFMIGGRVLQPNALVYDRKAGTRGVTLRNGQGVSIKNITSSTTGSVSYVFEFTDEVA